MANPLKSKSPAEGSDLKRRLAAIWGGRLAGLSFALVILGSCATAPPRGVVPLLSKMGAISLSHKRVGPLTFTSTYTFLPGSEKSARLQPSSMLCGELGTVTVHAPDQSIATNALALACDTWRNVASYFNAAVPIDEIALDLVPEGVAYRKRHSSIGLGGIQARLAIRYFTKTPELANRHVVRALAHELYHLHALHVSGARGNGEQSAYLLESCVELQVLGSTYGDLTAAQDNRAMLEAPGMAGTTAATSIAEAIEANAFVKKLTGDGALHPSDPRAARLLDECERVAARG